MKQLIEVYDILDDSKVNGEKVKNYLLNIKQDADIVVYPLKGDRGITDMIRIIIPGTKGKIRGGEASTLGILGRLGGLGARPEMIGFVSDGDGALTVLAIAAKLLDMQTKGDYLEGDIIISTHICPNAPTKPHHPVPFMGSPVDIAQVNKEEVNGELDAILSVDTTKGNRIINHRGFAISPTVKEGYILKVSDDLLNIMQITTGEFPKVFALSLQDITPYGNGIYHLNSILQPSTATNVPVVGVAITTETAVPGCATGTSHITDIEEAARFILEVAKAYTKGNCHFYDKKEYDFIKETYGSMKRFQTLDGKE